MKSRMERYSDEVSNNNINYSRSTKNSELYKNIGSNSKYTNFTDVSNVNAVELNSAKQNSHTREGYHQIKEYDNVIPAPKVKRELDDFNYLYQDHKNRVYDINTILEEARKNRIEKDQLEEKRKLKNTNYNILADLNPEELEKYKERKKKPKRPNDDEIRELIDTITSKTLAGEISKQTGIDLLGDLMATNVIDKVDNDKIEEMDEDIDKQLDLSKEILDKESIKKVNNIKNDNKSNLMNNADSDFYTRSMDLSDKDFDMDDEFGDKKVPVLLKIFLIIILLSVIGGAIYFILRTF